MTSTDPYRVLGVTRSATAAEIKAAYRLLAHERHPDKQSGSHEAFVQLTAAYKYALTRCGGPPGSSASTSPPPRPESFDEFMARTYRHWERFAQEQEEYFRHMHARAPFRLLWWRLSHDMLAAAHDLAKLLRRKS
jgi:hypothetical protein